MSPLRTHPAPERWLRWVERRVPEAESAEMARHLERCARCRRDVELMRRVEPGRAVPAWRGPSAAALAAAARMPSQRGPGRVDAGRARAVEWTPRDVRGIGAVDTGEAQMISRYFDAAGVAVLAVPPGEAPEWRFDGRVWLRRPMDGAIRVVLAHEDHVLASVEIADGGRFRFSEVVGNGWTLEIHLPDGEVLVLKDPYA